MNNRKDWGGYYDAIKDTHTKSLQFAVNQFCKNSDYALDIGAGNLRDTKFLLDQGFSVVAIDPSPITIEIAKTIDNTSLTIFSGFAGAYEFPEDYFSIVNAQGILFHFPKLRFDFVLEKIKISLKTGGILCANFIGEKDDWNYEGTGKTITTIEDLNVILKDFEIVSMKEFEQDETEDFAHKKGASKPKHWHQIVVVAIKK